MGLIDARRPGPAGLVLDFAQVGHVLVFGASGSGKTELLRTLAVAAARRAARRALPLRRRLRRRRAGGLADWPSVGSIVSELEIGRVLRLLRLLRRTVWSATSR